LIKNHVLQINKKTAFSSSVKTRRETGTRQLPGSCRVLHYPALPGPGWVFL